MYMPHAACAAIIFIRPIRGDLNLMRCEDVQKDLTTAECT
jgi:hypothetical protein